jgi:DNA-binding Lrp family transcriptional regulator
MESKTMSKMEGREAFEERWAAIKPLYFLAGSERLTLTQIGKKLGISASQVSRVIHKARDLGLTSQRNPAARRAPFRGINYGSMPMAMLGMAEANPQFRNWVIAEAAMSNVNVCELALSTLLDAYYEETQTA